MANEKPINNDSVGRTFLVVFILCLVCSIVVAGAAVGLKPQQQEQIQLDTQRNILSVAGLLQPKMTAEEVQNVYKDRIEPKLLNFKTNELSDSTSRYDLNSELRSEETSIALLQRILQKSAVVPIALKSIWLKMKQEKYHKLFYLFTVLVCGLSCMPLLR